MSRKQVDLHEDLHSLESELLNAFKRGTKQNAVRLLPQVSQLADIRITTDYKVVVNDTWKIVVASGSGQLEVVKYLINEQHCDPLAKDCDKRTLLHFACQRFDSLGVVKYLINEQNCDPMSKDTCNRTPLHYTCQYGNVCVVQYLINELHCDPMTKDKFGWTPLHFACYYDEVCIAQYLLSTGKVDPLAKNDDGKTAMYYVADWSQFNLMKLLRYFIRFKIDFPVHTYTKLILTG